MVSELSTSKVISLSCESFDEDLHPNDHEGLRANEKKKKNWMQRFVKTLMGKNILLPWSYKDKVEDKDI